MADGTNSKKPGAKSWAEAEALVADRPIELPTVEQWTDFVRSLGLGSMNYVPGDAKTVRLRAWWQGLAVLKLVEAQPGLRGRGLTDPLRRVLNALEEQLAGRQPALLTVKRGEGYQWLSTSPAMARLKAYVVHFAVAMMAGSRRVGAFGADDAAEVVARHINDAGFDWEKEGGIQSRDAQQRGEGISPNTVTKWRRAVQKPGRPKHDATSLARAVDPETLKMFEGLQLQLRQDHPEYKQWSRERRLEWLKSMVARIAGRGAFAEI
jgi:hypothetical protein